MSPACTDRPCLRVQLVGLPVEDATKLLLVAEVYNHKVCAIGKQTHALKL